MTGDASNKHAGNRQAAGDGGQGAGPAHDPRAILFVCLGNICRSPLAEGLFVHLAQRRGVDGLTVDSAGTGHWHVGERPDRRAQATADRYGIALPSVARQVDPGSDFARFGLIVPMDASNHRDLLRLGCPAGRLRRMRAFDPAHAHDPDNAPDVPDPYWGGEGGFDEVYHMLTRACEGLLDTLRQPAQ